MAALRNGIGTVILPKQNEKDLEEIDQTVRAALRFVLVERADEVLAEALSGSRIALADTARAYPEGEKLTGTSRGVVPIRQ